MSTDPSLGAALWQDKCAQQDRCAESPPQERVFKETRTEQNRPRQPAAPARLHTATGTSPAPNATSNSESQELLGRCQQEHTAGSEHRKGHSSSPGTGSGAGDRPGCLQHLLDKGSAVFLCSFDTSCPRNYIRKASAFRKERAKEGNKTLGFFLVEAGNRRELLSQPEHPRVLPDIPEQLTEETTTRGGTDGDTTSMQWHL